MYKIQTLDRISAVGLDNFPRDDYEIASEIMKPDAILVRSHDMLSMELDATVKAVARAGAGVNNIPVKELAQKGVVVFNTPGANANGVKELVLAGLLLAARDVVGGIDWVKENKELPDLAKQVEKAKSAYAGYEIKGKKLGVIGLGAIGVEVANAAVALGMEVYGYDPYISVANAWKLSQYVKNVKSLGEIYSECDYITVHVPLMDSTKGMINKDTMAMMKDGVKILNFSRDALVNDTDMAAALESGKVAKYVTDFPTDETVGAEGIVNIPHLGASTVESEDHCAVMAAKQLDEYLTNGNIKNSVNFPNVSLAHNSLARVCVMHKNVPNTISQITAAFASVNVNIENMANGSKGEVAYTIIETNEKVSDDVVKAVMAVDAVTRVICY